MDISGRCAKRHTAAVATGRPKCTCQHYSSMADTGQRDKLMPYYAAECPCTMNVWFVPQLWQQFDLTSTHNFNFNVSFNYAP
jgi:hypothetical protein